jgi:hypothetical protein
MKIQLILAAAAAAACAFSTPASSQSPTGQIISVYRAAPGHQVALLKWLADRDRIATAAGVAPSQLYVHANGDSWDYLTIAPQTTDAQDDAQEAAGKRLGLTTGPRVGIELRQHISYHTDTLVTGPTSAAAYLATLGEK